MFPGSGPPFHCSGGGGPQPHGGGPSLSFHHSCRLLSHHGPLSPPRKSGPRKSPGPWFGPLPSPHNGGQKSSSPCPGFNGIGAAGVAVATPAPMPAEPKPNPPTIMAVATTLITFIVSLLPGDSTYFEVQTVTFVPAPLM